MNSFPTDLNDSQWQVIKQFLNTKRKRKHDLRKILDAILYLVKTGCQWRMLSGIYPNWQIVYYYFARWKTQQVLDRIKCFLVKQVRLKQGRAEQPSAGIIDTQSVKNTLVSSSAHTGYDGGKKIKGIKRHIVVDTIGLLLDVTVHSANIADRRGAAMILPKLALNWSGITTIFADGGYPPPQKVNVKGQQLCGYNLEIVKRTELNTFKVVPKRWIVERTFAWLETNRRNAKSYERLPCTAEAIVLLSAIRIMLKQFK
jgi:putative transposase